MMNMREWIFNVVQRDTKEDKLSKAYDIFIVCIAFLSILPLAFQNPTGMLKTVLDRMETMTVYLLFLDYVLCWITHDYKTGKHSPWAFIMYVVSPMAIFNLLALLPSLGLIPSNFAVLRLFRLLKVVQYSKSCRHIVTVFRKERKTLLSVLVIALSYIFISALFMYVEEPEGTFNDFFHALYWATTALTTVGYGDVYPVTDLGRFISMVSSLFGIAVIALPAGVVTAGFMDAINAEADAGKEEEELEEEKSENKLLIDLITQQQEEIKLLRKEVSALRREDDDE